MAGEETRIIDRAVEKSDQKRRIAFADMENKMLKWALGALFLSSGAIGGYFINQYQVGVLAEEVKAMPTPEEHQGVHNLQDQDREYVKEKVDDIQAQQTIDSVKISNTEKNIWKIAEKLGVATE